VPYAESIGAYNSLNKWNDLLDRSAHAEGLEQVRVIGLAKTTNEPGWPGLGMGTG
jgi:hypothetical protein